MTARVECTNYIVRAANIAVLSPQNVPFHPARSITVAGAPRPAELVEPLRLALLRVCRALMQGAIYAQGATNTSRCQDQVMLFVENISFQRVRSITVGGPLCGPARAKVILVQADFGKGNLPHTGAIQRGGLFEAEV